MLKICPTCSAEFEVSQPYANQKFCSKQCRASSYPTFICAHCRKEFQPKQYTRTHNYKYCSHSCRIYAVQLWKLSPRNETQVKSTADCVICGKSFFSAPSQGYKTCSLPCQRKYKADRQRGEASHRWKGGITPEKTIIRNSLEYKIWRETILQRDKETCQLCNASGGKMVAHHILDFATNESVRLNPGNGITLCFSCHRKIKGKENEFVERFFAITGGIV